MGNWDYNPTYTSSNPIYIFKSPVRARTVDDSNILSSPRRGGDFGSFSTGGLGELFCFNDVFLFFSDQMLAFDCILGNYILFDKVVIGDKVFDCILGCIFSKIYPRFFWQNKGPYKKTAPVRTWRRTIQVDLMWLRMELGIAATPNDAVWVARNPTLLGTPASKNWPSWSLAFSPLKMEPVPRRSLSFWVSVTFQGRTVQLRRCIQ